MAKATYAPMFQTVSGALNKINKKSPHAADQKMVLTTHRKAATTSPDCSRVYLRGLSSITRSTPPSTDELWIRTRFAEVSAAVAARKKDHSKINADKARREGYGSKKVRGSIAFDPEYPGCPHCGESGFYICSSCGTIVCWHGDTKVTCPKCGKSATVTEAEEFDLKGGGY